MLIPCPECERKVSDRAKACPDCGFPVAEQVVERQREVERELRLESREHVGEIDCPRCDARGFSYFQHEDEHGESRQLFSWCDDCKHSGRVHQCSDLAGFYAVSHAALEAFLAGRLESGDEGVTPVGEQRVVVRRYEQAKEAIAEGESSDDDSSGE